MTMENRFATSQAVDVATSKQDQAATEGNVFTAHNGSIINAPTVSNVNITNGNLIVNANCTHAPVATDQVKGVAPKLKENIQNCQDELKSYLQLMTMTLSQGTEEEPSSTSLNKIYTELYITEGGSGEVNTEHEVIELECTRSRNEERKIDLNDIFSALPNKEPPQRVLTKGIAGIGKTVAVKKFTRDWADGEANQAFTFVFPFTFRELNLIKEKEFTLIDLICYYFEEVEGLDISDYKSSKLLFIFDGLDESKFPLNFAQNGLCRNATMKTTVDILLTNLFEGKLLPKASVWITTRPAAANKIPLKHINRVTEVRGFNDEQKEEYFQKKISDKTIAQKVLDHLLSKPLRSLYIMCHIPMFCWISATALQNLLVNEDQAELPKTLTEMYMHFLIKQTELKNQKDYHGGDSDRDMIMKLGKLAFEQLQNGNIIFSEEDLKECNIDLKQAAVYSGICTQIIRKESGLHKKEVYSFIHLSVQEFLAALYVHKTFVDQRKNLLSPKAVIPVSEGGESPIIFLHKSAVDMALEKDHGRWDLFLRFLVGLSKDKNQGLLKKIFGEKDKLPQSREDTIGYIHRKIQKTSYTNKGINLFHCLNELGDQSLVEQVQKYYNSGDVSKISPIHWSALAFVLLVSNDDLSVFDLRKYHGSEAVLERLLPVLKVAKIALLSESNLTDRCCSYVSPVLTMKSGGLEELDLSGNHLKDSGVQLLAGSLQDASCKLSKLRLRQCGITTSGCPPLARGITSNPSHLRELDLSKNKLHDMGLMQLSDVLENCRLETLRLSGCGLQEIGCTHLASALCSNPSYLHNLDLSRNSFSTTSVNQLSNFLQHPDSKLQRLWLFKTNLQADDAAVLLSALKPDHLKELDLGANTIGVAGAQKLSELLKNPKSKLEALRLQGCRFTDEGCAVLASSLKTNPAHLRDLDLGRNIMKEHAIEELSKFLEDQSCRLEILNLKCCIVTEAGCQALIVAVSRCFSLRELNLKYNLFMDESLELMCDWLSRTECKLEVLRLSFVKENTCLLLAAALRSNPSHLRELELSNSHLEESVKFLTNDDFKLTVTDQNVFKEQALSATLREKLKKLEFI
ncbi:NACHT, LRR and PYD domains-containing protein 12-like isoform X1 [Gambusia affinis]|uniref:NACHT, LRR and PYD domains-containing protein 12-like isoform X1 n=2 Tax=Gambusia affinis TaxID=33528 RepID=UPI001CDC22D8|nr:NACHT, LRR and PYD domains-containing protein 12-like isoform X1 [Gambusia affinis]XP_044000547.1 NACHT, LRR and PYD domains-containing protein 12-like isoform X1 [Gambusia affinis]